MRSRGVQIPPAGRGKYNGPVQPSLGYRVQLNNYSKMVDNCFDFEWNIPKFLLIKRETSWMAESFTATRVPFLLEPFTLASSDLCVNNKETQQLNTKLLPNAFRAVCSQSWVIVSLYGVQSVWRWQSYSLHYWKFPSRISWSNDHSLESR